MHGAERMTDANMSVTSDRAHRSEFVSVAAYSILGALPFSMLLFMPMFVGGFVTDLGFSERAAGYIASINIAGSGLAAFFAFLWVSRVSIRAVLTWAYIIFILANAVSMFMITFMPLAAVRFVEGLAAGTISSGIIASIAKTRSPDRKYGVWLAAQLLYGTIGFLLIPALFTKYGVGSGFAVIAALSILGLPLLRFVPTKGETTVQTASTRSFSFMVHPLWGVASIFVFYVGLNVIWAYLERIGDHAGLSIEEIGTSLSAANFAGLSGAILVAVIGSRFGRFWPVSIALLITAASVLLLLGTPTAMVYGVAICIYLFGWIFLVPLMLGAVAEIDDSGRYVTLANAALGVGLSLGPVLGALLIGDTEAYGRSIYLSSLLMLASLFVILPLIIKRNT